MDGMRLCIILAISALVSVMLKDQKSTIAPYVAIFGIVGTAAFILGRLTPVVEYIGEIVPEGEDWPLVVVRALGIAYVTQIGADICRDGGENGLGGAVETVGRCEIAVIVFPLIKHLFDVCGEMVQL